MTRLRITALLIAALLFTAVLHNHPVAQASGPCAVCVHQEAVDLPVGTALTVDQAWSSAVPESGTSTATGESVTAVTRGPPAV